MEDVKTALWAATARGEHLGRVIQGLRVLKTRCAELILVRAGQEPLRFASGDLAMTLDAITVGGETLAAFDDVSAWERSDGDPCICFELDGDETIVAPGTALDPEDIERTIIRFERQWHPEAHHVYVSDIDGSLPGRGIDALYMQEGVLHVNGHDLTIAEMVWAEDEVDGDGNHHCHVVMADGRYRRLCLGDLGR